MAAIIRYRDGHGRFCSRATAARLSNLHCSVSTEVSRAKSAKTAKRTEAYIKPADIKPGKPLKKPTPAAPPTAPMRRPPLAPLPRFEPEEDLAATYRPAREAYHDEEEGPGALEYEEEILGGYEPLDDEDAYLDDEGDSLDILDVDEDKYGGK